MDPNETLARIHRTIDAIQATDPSDRSADAAQAMRAYELAMDVANLSAWLARGGFLPMAWDR